MSASSWCPSNTAKGHFADNVVPVIPRQVPRHGRVDAIQKAADREMQDGGQWR